MTDFLGQLEQALLSLDRLAARQVLEAADKQLSSVQFVELIVVPVLEKIGKAWEEGQLALSQIYMAGRICEELVDTILPAGSHQRKGQPRMAVAVLEDYHLLGKRVVYSLLRASGYALQDYGRVTVDQLVQRVDLDQIELLLISTLMLPSALRVRELRDQLDGGRDAVKIIVGGAPFRFDRQLWQEVGADAMGSRASEAVSLIEKVMGGQA